MNARMLNASTRNIRCCKPGLVRAHVVPQALSRRHRYRSGPCGPSLMALSPLDAFFDMSPSQLLETEEFQGLERSRTMAVDFVEDSDGFQIKADIPGVAKEDIKLDMDHNVITISAKRSMQSSSGAQGASTDDKTTQEQGDSTTSQAQNQRAQDKIMQEDADVLRFERYDSFQSRSFRVPKTADLSSISAKYEDGVLTVDIGKRADVVDLKRTIDIA